MEYEIKVIPFSIDNKENVRRNCKRADYLSFFFDNFSIDFYEEEVL
jgi:hypothetical protein